MSTMSLEATRVAARAGSGDRGAFLKVLRRVPDAPPVEGDELPPGLE
jgi:hypothetical protein